MATHSVFFLRAFAGFGLSVLLAFGALMFARVLLRLVIADLVIRGYLGAGDVYVFTLFTGIGAGAGIGAALGWLGSDISPRLRSFHMLGWILLGVAVSWAAYVYKTEIDPYASFESNEVSQLAMLWAIVVPNVIASAIGLYRHIRLGPM